MKRVMAIVLMVGSLAGTAFAFQPPTRQGEFVPVGSLPAVESMPAAPMVIAAYAVVWAAMLVYVWSLWRRLHKVERDIADLERRARDRQE